VLIDVGRSIQISVETYLHRATERAFATHSLDL
jgi:hypothetical protein